MWVSEFRCARINTTDTDCYGRSIEVSTLRTIETIHIIGEWKCAKSWKPYTYHKALRFRFCIFTWVWEAYQQHRCHVCSQLATNAIVWQRRRNGRYCSAFRTTYGFNPRLRANWHWRRPRWVVSHDDRLLGCMRYNPLRLPSKGKNNQRWTLCLFNERV